AHNCLVGTGLRQSVRLGASGRVVTGFDIARLLALGADWCNAARGFMFALGCIQAQSCHTDRCPTGVSTQNPWRQRALVVDDKAARVRQFHLSTLAALGELVGAAGLAHPSHLRPMHILKRVSPSEVQSFAEVYTFLQHRELLSGVGHSHYVEQWALADAQHFAPLPHVQSAAWLPEPAHPPARSLHSYACQIPVAVSLPSTDQNDTRSTCAQMPTSAA